ncbi:MAG: YidB family protein [Roseiarcus sp.]|jgi:uncharacterized protein YidB (DUF937 family)
MGLLDSLGGGLKSALEQFGVQEMQTLLPAALAKTNLGDLSGLVTQLQQGGLGAQVQSWLANGNVSVTPQQIEAALGSDQVKQLAQHFGVDPDAALKLLAQHLPALVGQSGAAQS